MKKVVMLCVFAFSFLFCTVLFYTSLILFLPSYHGMGTLPAAGGRLPTYSWRCHHHYYRLTRCRQLCHRTAPPSHCRSRSPCHPSAGRRRKKPSTNTTYLITGLVWYAPEQTNRRKWRLRGRRRRISFAVRGCISVATHLPYCTTY